MWARPLDCRLNCRITKPGRAEDRRSGLSPQILSVRRAGQAAIRSGGRTSSGSKTSSVKTLRSSGFWLMRNWRKLRSRRSRIETYCLSRLPPRSGCDVAVLAAPLRPGYHNARGEGWAVNHEKMQCLWREQRLRVPQRRRHNGHGSPSAPPTVIADAPDRVRAVDFQFDVTTDGWPIKIVPIVDEPRESSAGWSSAERLSFRGPVHGSGHGHWRSRTDPSPVTPLGAAGASRRAGSRISRRTRCRGVRHRLRDRRCPPSEHR